MILRFGAVEEGVELTLAAAAGGRHDCGRGRSSAVA